jgi:hypothetical protein
LSGKAFPGGAVLGVGIYRLGLITFPVFFQCKKYAGTVDPHQVRDFRGAMAGRGEKGLLITTGRFTADARREANRDGATPIELIDGDKLCDLLKRYELGVTTTVRQVEDVTVDAGFFADIWRRPTPGDGSSRWRSRDSAQRSSDRVWETLVAVIKRHSGGTLPKDPARSLRANQRRWPVHPKA